MTTFLFDFGHVELTVDQIWPDKDGPENPTAQDVIEAMGDYAVPRDVVVDWNLIDELNITELPGRTKATLR